MADAFTALLDSADGLHVPGVGQLRSAYLAAPPEGRNAIVATLRRRIEQARADAVERQDTLLAIGRLRAIMDGSGGR